jgi:hypothetical protein
MPSASTYNRQAVGRIWRLVDLPVAWPGYAILLKGDRDKDLVIEPAELDDIDWISFSEAVGDFQRAGGIAPVDSKLGPETLKGLREFYGLEPSVPGVLKRTGDLVFASAEVPASPPPGSPLVGRNAEEKRICYLWNQYGAAIHQQSSTHGVPTTTALAVFSVESGTAYDLATGLLIIRFEPHVFREKAGQSIPWTRNGQKAEWDNFDRAYEANPEAALLSCSYGLPQLMGFNWRVTRHRTVREMVLAFQNSCIEQVRGFFDFVETNTLMGFIQHEDWRSFARHYNGPGNVDDYSGRLTRALKVVQTLAEDGAQFDLE